ncbi:MAG: AmmeMemoRadiSam system protein B [Planctomycetota bacterium]|nr:AmmeMemoRadiSam system protein B [Planctomycetota bacterium]
MPFSDLPEHLLMPALRQFQPFGLKKDNKPYVGLRDPFMLTEETIVIPAQAFAVIQRIDGETTSENIAKALGAPPDKIIDLLKRLDSVGLLWGPTAKKLEEEAIANLRSKGVFPVRSSGSLGESADECLDQLKQWFEETEDPEFETPIKAIVAPHLDYARGWPNYASAYFSWKNTTPPDRVVILGTNHFGNGDGVVLSTIGHASPLGVCPADTNVVDKLEKQLGKGATIDLIDHAAEHSIELHLPWLQYCFGNLPIVAALIPNPLVEMIDDDGKRTTTDEFINSLQSILQEVGGKTLYVSSADLSHVGKQFGEPRPVDEQRKFDVERHDREMMAKFLQNDADEFVAAMQWNNNATQWCSIGNMSATLKLVQPSSIELIDYRQTVDENGFALVSSCAIAMM